MNPALLIAVIIGGMSGVFTNVILGSGLVAPASPGSILAVMAMTAKGYHLQVIISVLVSTVVSFVIGSVFVKRQAANSSDEDMAMAQEKMKAMKAESKGQRLNVGSAYFPDAKDIKKIVFACDAGMGSSAMGASKFKSRIKNYKGDVTVVHSAVAEVPDDTDVVVTHENLVGRVSNPDGRKEIITIKNFLKDENLDGLFERFNKYI